MNHYVNYLGKSLLVVGGLGTVLSLHAAQEGPFKTSANVALTTDYVFRGFTQTDEKPAIQGGFDINHETGAYFKTWASNVKFLENETVPAHDRASLEVDATLGYQRQLNDNLTYGLQVARFMYPGAGSDLNYDMTEFNLNFKYAASQTEWGFNYDYSPQYSGEVDKSHHYNLSFNYALSENARFGGYVGQLSVGDNEKFGYDDYRYYGLSLSYSTEALDTSLTYSNTDVDSEKKKDKADGRLVFTLSKTF